MQQLKSFLLVTLLLFCAMSSVLLKSTEHKARFSQPRQTVSRAFFGPMIWTGLIFGGVCIAKNMYNRFVLKRRHTLQDLLNGRIQPTGKLDESLLTWKRPYQGFLNKELVRQSS